MKKLSLNGTIKNDHDHDHEHDHDHDHDHELKIMKRSVGETNQVKKFNIKLPFNSFSILFNLN